MPIDLSKRTESKLVGKFQQWLRDRLGMDERVKVIRLMRDLRDTGLGALDAETLELLKLYAQDHGTADEIELLASYGIKAD